MNVYQLQVFRDGSPLVNIEIDEKTVYSKVLMGDHGITSQVTIIAPLPLAIGDYVPYAGKTYVLNKLPNLSADDVSFTYDLILEPRTYTLYDKKFKHLGAKTFTYFGDSAYHLALLISNITEIDPGWSAGFVEQTSEIYINYDKDDCRTALTKIADAFKLEYDVDERVITLRKTIGTNTGLTFEVGQFKGLYKLDRQSVDDSAVVTRAYGYGGSRNIDYKYRGGAKQLMFEGEYLERNVDLYPNAKEGDYENEEIYPNRTGSVTVATTNIDTKVYTIVDSSIDFNLNDYLQEGTPAKIVFKSGELSGSQFEIVKYDHSTKTITYKEFKDTNDYSIPNTTYQAAIGDTYTLIDINMPQSYIDAAEDQLRRETEEYLEQNSIPRVIYQLDIDEKYVRDNGISLKAGDYITVKDARLGLDGLLRVSAINWPLVNESAIQCTISNFILDSTSNRIISEVKNAQVAIKNNYTSNILETRRQTSNLAELRDSVFDPEGDYYTDKIKPGTVETLYLTVGAKANDFNLSEVVIKANLNGNPNSIEITGGRLLHNSITINAGFTWILSGITEGGLTSSSRYYVYSKCSKSSLVGTFVVSQNQIKLEDVSGYYHFNIGVLYPVKDGFRDFEFTKGMAYIVGDTVTAGRIKSIDAQTYWDLTQGQFKLGNSSYGMDWNVTTPNTLTLRGALVQNPGGAVAPINLFRGSYTSGNTYYKGDTVQYNGSTWTYINNAPGNSTPSEGDNWTASAKKGDDGTSVKIKGSVPTSSGLPTTGNEVGDGYLTNDTGDLWMWNGSSWDNLGTIRGPQGETGPVGKSIRVLFAKSGNPETAPQLDQVESPSGWSEVAPTVDDNLYLTDNTGNIIATTSGDLIALGYSYEFLWMTVEVVDGSGMFQSWSAPNRLTGTKGNSADFVDVKFAKNGSPTSPPPLNVNDSDPNGWTIQAPSLSSLEYLWKIYGTKEGEFKQLIGAWNGPYRETAVDGANGINGTSSFFHTRYSPNANGSGMSSTPNTYIGTVVTNSPSAPTEYTQYTWVRLMGAQGADGQQGIPGNNGANGQTSYLHIKYSNDGGLTFTSSTGETPGDYIGQYVDFAQADSNNVNAYTWSLIKGASGAQGPSGPLPTGGDIYSSSATYVGNSTRVSIVRYNDGTGEKAYVARVDAGTFNGIAPTNTSKWNAFGGQYESVATKLFFAQLAYIENLGVRYLATDTQGKKRVQIDGDLNNIRVLDANDNILIEADDDSAVESISIKPNDPPLPPDTVFHYGPGVRVGSFADTLGASSMSRKGFLTNGFTETGDLKFSGTLRTISAGQEFTGWSGFVVVIASGNQTKVGINNMPSIPFGATWVRYTYRNGVLVNVEGISA